MLKFFALFISVCTCISANAQPSVTGYVTTTQFSNTNYFESSAKTVLRWYVPIESTLTMKGSLTTYGTPIQTGALEWQIPTANLNLMFDFQTLVTVGRYGRINSINNDITDNPGTFGVAMLPPGAYPTRLVAANMTIADGVQVTLTKLLPNHGLMTFKTGLGTGVLSLPTATSTELIGKGWSVAPIEYGARDIYLSYENLGTKYYIARNEFPYLTTHPRLDRLDQYIHRIGFSRDFINNVTFEAELIRYVATGTFLGTKVSDNSYDGGSFTVKYCLTDDVLVYASYSKATTSSNTQMQTNTVGATYEGNTWTGSISYMDGTGNMLPNSYSTRPEWSSVIVSFTKRF